jgi:16S rRNA (guanine527-N7)-methyltransferase
VPFLVSKDERALPAMPPSVPLPVPEGLGARLAAAGISAGAATLAQLGDYLARMLAMNEQMNLTAIKDAEGAWERHGLDALTLLPLLAEVPAGARLVDIGSGGGIPGIPLAIARPDLGITLVESTQKKAAFLAAVSRAMGLANVSVHAERAEQLLRGPLRGAFDVVTARAVARLDALVPLTVPFVRPGGLVLLVKGQRAEEELAEAASVLARHEAAHEQTVPTPTGRIVVLRRARRA